jgi:metal-responsive CopG/Arc/MetJ family transcriptional regulator
MDVGNVTKSEYVTIRLPTLLIRKLDDESEKRGMRRATFIRSLLINKFLNFEKSEGREALSDEK